MSETNKLRLKDGFRATFPFRRGLGTEFARWGRYHRDDKVSVSPHYYRPLRSGEAVPASFMQLFAEFASWKFEKRYLVSEIAEAADGGEDDDVPMTDALGWPPLLEYFSRQVSIPDEAYCAGERDVRFAAEAILEAVGETKTLSGGLAIRRGERIMGRTLDDYADMLARVQRADQRTVMFGTWHDGDRVRRVSVGVVIPLAKSFYENFRGGRAEDSDIRRGDVKVPSPYVHVNGGAQLKLPDIPATRARARRSMGDATSVLWQLASLCPVVLKSFPRFISFGGTERNEERLRSYSFVPTGVSTPRTGKPIFELRPPTALSPGPIGHYGAMLALLLLFQSYVNGQSLFDE